MKIIPDGEKYIIDLEGENIDLMVLSPVRGFCLNDLFNWDVVSLVRNGNFEFTKPPEKGT